MDSTNFVRSYQSVDTTIKEQQARTKRERFFQQVEKQKFDICKDKKHVANVLRKLNPEIRVSCGKRR